MTTKDIVYENGDYWVYKTKDGTFEVYKVECTYSVRCAQIGYKGDVGLKKAIAECDKRNTSTKADT